MEIQLQSWRTLNLYSKSHRTPRYQKQEKKTYFNSNIHTLQIMQLVATLLTGVAVVGVPGHVTKHKCSIQVTRQPMGSHRLAIRTWGSVHVTKHVFDSGRWTIHGVTPVTGVTDVGSPYM